MAQDTVQQAIVRINRQLPTPHGGMTDYPVALSGLEWDAVLDALQEFIAVPGEPGPIDQS
jgi:hypothetical protein